MKNYRLAWVTGLTLFCCLADYREPTMAQEIRVTPDSPNLTPTQDVESLSSQQMAQITSVSELRDVAPTDWAYEALRSLVERYGCIVGYPNQT
jgi:hypothetical protein